MFRNTIRILVLIVGLIIFIAPINAYAVVGDVWISSTSISKDVNNEFALEVHADTGSEKLGSYMLNIIFDPNNVKIDTTKGNNGVEVGVDGFLAGANPDNTNGTLKVSGMDGIGQGPGNNLTLLIIHFNTIDGKMPGDIHINVENLTNELGREIGVNK